MLSRFVALSVSLTSKASLLQGCYPPTRQCVPGKSAVLFEDILFERISGTAWHGAVFHCDPAAPCRGISLADVDLRPARPKDDVAMSCSNAAGRARNVTPASCLKLDDGDADALVQPTAAGATEGKL